MREAIQKIQAAHKAGRITASQAMAMVAKCNRDDSLGPLGVDAHVPDDAFQPLPMARGLELRVHQFPQAIIHVPNIVSLAANTTSPIYPVEFGTDGGWVIGLRGTIVTSTTSDLLVAGRTSVGVAMNLNGQRDFFTSGTAVDYPLFDELFPGGAADGWMGFELPIRRTDKLNFTFKNYSVGTAFIPSISLAFRPDPR